MWAGIWVQDGSKPHQHSVKALEILQTPPSL